MMIWDYHKLLGVMSNYLCSFAISLKMRRKMCTDWLEFLCMYMFKAICNTDARGYFLSLWTFMLTIFWIWAVKRRGSRNMVERFVVLSHWPTCVCLAFDNLRNPALTLNFPALWFPFLSGCRNACLIIHRRFWPVCISRWVDCSSHSVHVFRTRSKWSFAMSPRLFATDRRT